MRMKHEDDYGVNEDSNLSHSVRASNKEDSQRTTTQTDNEEERLRKREGSSMHDDSYIGINYAHMFPQVFQVTSHIVEIFALHFVSSIQLLSLYPFIQFLTCTRIPCRDSHCQNGSFEVLSLHLPVGYSRPPSAVNTARFLHDAVTLLFSSNRSQKKKLVRNLRQLLLPLFQASCGVIHKHLQLHGRILFYHFAQGILQHK